MKTLSLVFCLFCFSDGLYNPTIKVIHSSVVSGTNNLTHETIFGSKYSVKNKSITDYKVQPEHATVVLFMNHGTSNQMFAVYNLETDLVQFSQYIYGDEILVTKNGVISTYPGAQYVDAATGHEDWKIDSDILYVDPAEKVALAYKAYGKKFSGIDLLTGKTLWTRNDWTYIGRDEVVQMGDSVFLFAGMGLHAINLYTGSSWDLAATTMARRPSVVNQRQMMNDLTDIIFVGVIPGDENYADVMQHISSNVLITDEAIYYSTKDSLYCLGTDGRRKWTHELPSTLSSFADIVVIDDVLYLINRGFALAASKRINFGTPFLAAYSIHTGAEVYHYLLSAQQINNFIIDDQNITLFTSKGLLRGNLTTGEMSHSLRQSSGFGLIPGAMYYQMSPDSVFHNIAEQYPSEIFFKDASDNIIIFNNVLDQVAVIPVDRIFYNYDKLDDIKLLANSGKTILVNSENQIIAWLHASGLARVYGSSLYEIDEETLTVVDLRMFRDHSE